MTTLYCQIRKDWVTALPEEVIRQRILTHMISNLEFPSSLIAVECALRSFPHLNAEERAQAPNRRADIVCYTKDKLSGQLHPLLVIECKAVKLSPSVINQVLGYNHFIKAQYVAIANDEEVRFGWYDLQQSKFVFIDFMPNYSSLIA